MHLSLNVKFILAYIAFAILSFVGISTLTSRLMLDNATRTRVIYNDFDTGCCF